MFLKPKPLPGQLFRSHLPFLFLDFLKHTVALDYFSHSSPVQPSLRCHRPTPCLAHVAALGPEFCRPAWAHRTNAIERTTHSTTPTICPLCGPSPCAPTAAHLRMNQAHGAQRGPAMVSAAHLDEAMQAAGSRRDFHR
jgi:hypothetical protein